MELGFYFVEPENSVDDIMKLTDTLKRINIFSIKKFIILKVSCFDDSYLKPTRFNLLNKIFYLKYVLLILKKSKNLASMIILTNAHS